MGSLSRSLPGRPYEQDPRACRPASLRLRLSLSAGQAHYDLAALVLLVQLNLQTVVLVDKAYDGNVIRDLIEAQGAVPNTPVKSKRNRKPCFSIGLYRERNQVERFFS